MGNDRSNSFVLNSAAIVKFDKHPDIIESRGYAERAEPTWAGKGRKASQFFAKKQTNGLDGEDAIASDTLCQFWMLGCYRKAILGARNSKRRY